MRVRVTSLRAKRPRTGHGRTSPSPTRVSPVPPTPAWLSAASMASSVDVVRFLICLERSRTASADAAAALPPPLPTPPTPPAGKPGVVVLLGRGEPGSSPASGDGEGTGPFHAAGPPARLWRLVPGGGVGTTVRALRCLRSRIHARISDALGSGPAPPAAAPCASRRCLRSPASFAACASRLRCIISCTAELRVSLRSSLPGPSLVDVRRATPSPPVPSPPPPPPPASSDVRRSCAGEPSRDGSKPSSSK